MILISSITRKRVTEKENIDYFTLDVEGDEDLNEGCIFTFIHLVVTGNHTFQPDTQVKKNHHIVVSKNKDMCN